MLPSLPSSELADFASGSASWMTGLRTPAALVAGSALSGLNAYSKEVTLDFENDTVPQLLAKRSIGILLVTAFIFEISVIFVATVTSTKLLANADAPRALNTLAKSSVGLMHRELEFEYVIIRFGFLQGLLHWLGSVGLKLLLPAFDKSKPTPERAIARFYSRAFLTLAVASVAFYNKHLSFYGSYVALAWRFATISVQRVFEGMSKNPISWLWAAVFFWTLRALFDALRADLAACQEKLGNKKTR